MYSNELGGMAFGARAELMTRHAPLPRLPTTSSREFQKGATIHAQYEWTTGVPDNGMIEEEVPRRTSLVPLAFPCFVLRLVGLETKNVLDYQGRAGDHFHCTVERSPGHIRCRNKEGVFGVETRRAGETSRRDPHGEQFSNPSHLGEFYIPTPPPSPGP